MKKEKQVILTASINKFGHLLVKNKSRIYQAELYIQVDYEVTDFIQNYIPKKYHKDLDNGWDIKFKIALDIWYSLTIDMEIYHHCNKK